MRTHIAEYTVNLWLSTRDTYAWAWRPGAHWPCSTLANKRLFASFGESGLVELSVNGRSDIDVDAHEFNAITSDHLRAILPKDHPLYFVCVGQFLSGEDVLK